MQQNPPKRVSTNLFLLLSCACTSAVIKDDSTPSNHQPKDDTAIPTDDTGAGTDSGSTGKDSGIGKDDTGDGPIPIEYDCEKQPDGPWSIETITAVATEDIDFDQDGNLVGSDMSHIWRTDIDGNQQMWVPNFPFRAGMRLLSTGQLVVADNYQGALVRVEPDGSRETVLSGLSYPNGIEIGLDDAVYLTEHDGNRFLKVDAQTGDYEIVHQGFIQYPNGISFNEDFSALYIAGFSGVGTIYRIPVSKDGEFGEMESWSTGVGTGWLDGIAVDICGNVYIADYGASQILKLPPEGKTYEVLVDGSGLGGWYGAYMPNMQWGSGVGGWDTEVMYVPEGWMADRTYSIELGIPGKDRSSSAR